MSRHRIAIPIPFDSSLEEIKNKVILADQAQADFIEYRVDYWNSIIDQNFLETVKKFTKTPTIFTLRSDTEGGKSVRSDEERISILKAAAKLDFSYIDVELSTLLRLNLSTEDIKLDNRTKIIVSYHNFTNCDSQNDLYDIRDSMVKKNADICKIVVTSNGEESNERILALIKNTKELHREIIAIAMGEKGTITRKLGPQYGAFLTFVSLDTSSSTAPGQLTIDD